jgi:trehalose synthase
VSDDPAGAAVYRRTCAHRAALAPDVRARVHLLRIPMDDPDENAVIVNALQRAAGVVVQKSLAEGFGLTVTEAMWKARPVVASAVGGIADQIDHDRCGLLIPDPADTAACGAAIRSLLRDPGHARALGHAARERVRQHFLSDRSLIDYLHVLAPLAAATPR